MIARGRFFVSSASRATSATSTTSSRRSQRHGARFVEFSTGQCDRRADEAKKRLLQRSSSKSVPTMPQKELASSSRCDLSGNRTWSLFRQAVGGETPTFTTSERETGVKHAEVITSQLVQDERGRLRLG